MISKTCFAQGFGTKGSGPDGDSETFLSVNCEEVDKNIKKLEKTITKIYKSNSADKSKASFSEVLVKLSALSTLKISKDTTKAGEPFVIACGENSGEELTFKLKDFEKLKTSISDLLENRKYSINCFYHKEEVLKEIDSDIELLQSLKDLYEKAK